MKTVSIILKEMQTVCTGINEKQYAAFVELLKEDNKFYFTGEGRSGLISKAIAMRLMHSGKTVFVVGETTTPAIGKDDILVAISGSGNVGIAESASKQGAYVFLITTSKAALNNDWCNGGLVIPAATKSRHADEPATIQPLGNQFDQAAHLILDAAIIDSLTEEDSNEKMKRKHANLE